MRTLVKDGIELTIRQHIIVRNLWEYYITTRYPVEDDIQEALVLGYENEIGDISLSEIMPYAITKTTEITGVMPASGWDWKD